MFSDPAFWVAVSFFGFLAVLVYFKLPAMAAARLDERSDRIRHELDEAQRLREEAQALYAEYQRKAENAVQAAAAILEQVKTDSAAMAEESRAALDTALARRQALAEAKIARAEAQAIADVRNATIEAAIAAARAVMSRDFAGDKADQLIDDSIGELRRHLN